MWKSMRRGPMLQPPGMAMVGLAEARDQRPHDDDAGAHGAHQLVGRAAVERARRRRTRSSSSPSIDVGAQRAEHLDHGGDVRDARYAADDAGVGGEQARGQELERGVLGAREDDLALQAAAAAHQQARVVFGRSVHKTGTSIAGLSRDGPAQPAARRATARRFSARFSACSARKKSTSASRPGVAALLQPAARPLGGLLGAAHVDGPGELAVVDDDEHLVEEHLRVADAGGDVLPGVAVLVRMRVSPIGQQRDDGLVARQDRRARPRRPAARPCSTLVVVHRAVRRDDLYLQAALVRHGGLGRPGRRACAPARRPPRCRRP